MSDQHTCRVCGEIHLPKKLTNSILERVKANDIVFTQLNCQHEDGTYLTQYNWTFDIQNWIMMMAWHYIKFHEGIEPDKQFRAEVEYAVKKEAEYVNVFTAKQRAEKSRLRN